MYEIIVKIWDNYDLDGDGTISMEEAKIFVDTLVSMQNFKFEKNVILEAFESIDQNGDGEVDKEEMLLFFNIIEADGLQIFD
jgi:Ca2+-binding EF-hand superfamily protein